MAVGAISRTTHRKIKSAVWAMSFFAVTVTGAWFGAGLRANGQMKKRQQEAQSATLTDQLRQLEARRAEYVHKRIEVQAKLDRVIERQRQREERERGAGAGESKGST